MHVAGPGPESIGRHRQPHVLSSRPPVPPARHRAADPEPLAATPSSDDALAYRTPAYRPPAWGPPPVAERAPEPDLLARAPHPPAGDDEVTETLETAAAPVRRRHAAAARSVAEVPGRHRHGAAGTPARRRHRGPRRTLAALTLVAIVGAPVVARSASSLGMPDELTAQVAADPEQAQETTDALGPGGAPSGTSVSTAAPDPAGTAGPGTASSAPAAGRTAAPAAGTAARGAGAAPSVAAGSGLVVLEPSPVAGPPEGGAPAGGQPADAATEPAPGTPSAAGTPDGDAAPGSTPASSPSVPATTSPADDASAEVAAADAPAGTTAGTTTAGTTTAGTTTAGTTAAPARTPSTSDEQEPGAATPRPTPGQERAEDDSASECTVPVSGRCDPVGG